MTTAAHLPERTFIILVTGSRDWKNPDTVHEALDAFPNRPLIIRHGAAKRGVDALAAEWARGHSNVEEDPWPVSDLEWRLNPHYAGHARNAKMVAREPRADVCLAFIRDRSGGATNCANEAVLAGIPTFVRRESSKSRTVSTQRRAPYQGGIVRTTIEIEYEPQIDHQNALQELHRAYRSGVDILQERINQPN